MVSGKTNQRKTLVIVGVLILVASIFIIIFFLLEFFLSDNQQESVESTYVDETKEEAPEVLEPEVKLPVRIDFQPVIDEWMLDTNGDRSVLVYDLERDEVVGGYDQDKDYNTASLYKLFVVYEGYRRIQSGEWQSDTVAGATEKTILECLDLAIRESYSPCAEAIWGMIGYETLDEIIVNDYKITSSTISKLISNPNDIMKMMKIYYDHEDITDELLLTKMKDSLLNQPTTTYNWRQGLPSGFSRANVYNKVGWEWNGRSWDIYHDAAIVEFPNENRHFIVVIMTNNVSFQKICELGTAIENKYYGL